VPFMGILASAVHSPVGRSDASLGILRLLEIPSFDLRLKPFARPPAVDQNANTVQVLERSGILVNVPGGKEAHRVLKPAFSAMLSEVVGISKYNPMLD